MKLLPAILSSVILQTTSLPAQSTSILPPYRLETLAASDGSPVLCFTIDGNAGFKYIIEESGDLETWQETSAFYSLGHVHSHPLLRLAPPPPADPSSPPSSEPPGEPPSLSASILLRPAPGGGTLVCWNSFEHGNPVTVRLSHTPDIAWPFIPLYLQNYGDFQLFILQPTFPLTDPGPENPLLSGTDSLLLATLEEHFPAMNAEVASSAAIARNSPPPGPSDPAGRHFVRLRVLTLDSDNDGIRDDIEFLLAPQNHPLADPFNPDADGNGIPDGHQIDSDNDSTPDALDVDPTNPSDPGEIKPIPRYCLFPIQGGLPVAISDSGTVLFTSSTWQAGKSKPVRGTGYAINDHDRILSIDSKTFDLPEGSDPKSVTHNVFHLSHGHGEAASPVTDSAGYTAAPHSMPPGEKGLFSNDGVFSALSLRFGKENDDEESNAWRTGSGQPSRISRNPSLTFALDDSLAWGGGLVQAGNTLTSLYPESPRVVIPDGKVPSILRALCGSAAYTFHQGRWGHDPSYDWAEDIASDGTAIGYQAPRGTFDPEVTPRVFRINGQWIPFHRAAPGAPAWPDPTTVFLDMSPSGWALARRGRSTYHTIGGAGYLDPAYPEMETGVLMPIRVEGISSSTAFPLATGVDDFSLRASASIPAIADRHWIMVPAGSRQTTFRLESLANLRNILGFSTPEATLLPTSINTSRTLVKIGGADPAKTGAETHLGFTLGDTPSASTPIGLKIMKHRTVRVTVHKIARQRPSGNIEEPDLVPTEQDLRDHLDAIFLPQINTRFSVHIPDSSIPVNWDANGNHLLDSAGIDDELSDDQKRIQSSLPSETGPPPHIRVFLISSTVHLGIQTNAVGLTNRPTATCWILATKSRGQQNLHDLKETIAHEIGHVLFGYGHPNDRGAEPGPAPLPGTQHGYRLMREGTTPPINGGHLIVKQEWDEAEAWMKPRIDDPQ